jgi:hypothetical protein
VWWCFGLGLECLGERTARASEGQGQGHDLVGRDFGGCASVQVLRLFEFWDTLWPELSCAALRSAYYFALSSLVQHEP